MVLTREQLNALAASQSAVYMQMKKWEEELNLIDGSNMDLMTEVQNQWELFKQQHEELIRNIKAFSGEYFSKDGFAKTQALKNRIIAELNKKSADKTMNTFMQQMIGDQEIRKQEFNQACETLLRTIKELV